MPAQLRRPEDSFASVAVFHLDRRSVLCPADSRIHRRRKHMLKGAVMKLDPSMLLVPTSLDGIFAKVRSPGNVAEPMSIAPLFHSSVLARLQETDTPAARTFREKVLYRHWRPEDQLVPSFGPQSGATHQLTPRHRTANTAFTSFNWAGGTIQGPWTAAFGIWRVPAVTRPTIPAGTSGGWASSSWVGIDGIPTHRPTCFRPAYASRCRPAAEPLISPGSSGSFPKS
jgi:hypothetical protein